MHGTLKINNNYSFRSSCFIVSGFYAECPTKRVYGYGTVYTKSKFLGLSLAVYNIGKGKDVLSSAVHLSTFGQKNVQIVDG